MKRLIYLLIFGLMTILGVESCSSTKNSEKESFDNSVVDTLELDRYLGTWYEIARYDHSFERDMQGVKASYSVREDGLIQVINSGHKGSLDGKYKETKGKARIPDKNVPSKIEVAFFLNFWGDYYVMELADDYRYSLVGSSTSKYLWILSRTPQLQPSDKEFLLQRIAERGYHPEQLIWVEQ